MPVTGKGGLQYDISIVRTNGTTEVGLMLDEVNGKKVYQRVTDPTLAQQFFTGDPSYGKTEPEKLLTINQSSYMAGFGQEFFNNVSPNDKRYYTSVGADARFEDNVICGPKATAITLTDYSASITDGAMELWDDANTLTNWTKNGSSTLTQDGTIKHGGTYAASVEGSSDDYYYQDLSWDTKYQGLGVQIKGWIYTEQKANSTGFFRVNDGVDTTDSSAVAADATWEQKTIAHTMNASATQLRIEFHYNDVSSANKFVNYDDITWSYPAYNQSAKDAHAEFNNELYIGYGGILVKLNGAGDGFTFVNSFAGDEISALETFSDDNMYIALGTSAAYYYMNTSESFTQSSLGGADQQAVYFRNVNGVMYKYEATNVISKTVDPKNGGTAWSTATTVGTLDEVITSIRSIAGTPYIGKLDMPFYLDSSDDDFPIAEDAQFLDRTWNCYSMNTWHSRLYTDIGESGLLEYDGTDVVWRSPARFCTNLPDFSTQIVGITGDEEYLYILQFPDTGNIFPLLAGKPDIIDGSAIWVWHPVQHIDFTANDVTRGSLFISSVYKKRLWVSVDVGATNTMYWLPLTTQYGDITGDSDYLFQTGGYLITPWLHSNLKSDDKGFHSLTLTTEDCDANNYITVDYQTYFTALGGTWTNLGNFTTSPSQTRYFTNVTGTMIRFRFTLVTNSTSTTPKLTNFDVRGIWRPTKRQLIFCTVKLGDNIISRSGGESEGYQSMKDAIEEAVNQVKPNTFYDIDSISATGSRTSKSVNVLFAREFDVELTSLNKPTSKYELVLGEITTS